jgi:hypothetical protein
VPDLPPSALDASAYPKGPKGMAALCADRLAELQGQLGEVRTKAGRSAINKHIHLLKGLIRWSKSRAGYIEPQ